MEFGLFSSTTPFTPPTTEDGRLSWLRLIRSRRIGPIGFRRLMAEHGSAAAVLAELPAIARAAGARDYAPCPVGAAMAEVEAARRAGLRMLCLGEPDYPSDLATLTDAPPVLWMKGDAARLVAPMVALVGARNASSLGQRMAGRLARALGQSGLTVVSGLARGIDAAAHEAALPTGTVAVLAGGADTIYPEENARLAARIAEEGVILSEQPPGLQPQARHFPLRNRIISGLALGVVLVEAAERSGSLITARNALDQGREVMAVPGHPADPRAAGCNQLIREGCTLVRNAEDIEEALEQVLARAGERRAMPSPPPPRPNRIEQAQQIRPDGDGSAQARAMAAHLAPPTVMAADLASAILARLGPSALHEDQLLRDLALPVARVAPELLLLELAGRITRLPGGYLCLPA